MRILPSIVVAFFPAVAPAASAADAKPTPKPVQLAWPSVARPIRLAAVVPARPGDAVRLVRPFGVAVDGAGRIFLADPAQRALIVYQPDGGVSAQWKGNAAHPLVGPVAVTTDREGRVFAVDGYQAHVVVFDPTGQPIGDFGKGLLKRPEGIAIDSAAGRIYVGDVKLHQVFVFDLRTWKMERVLGGSSTLRFDSPAQVAVNSAGRLIVSDSWHCRVQILEAGGALVKRFPTQCAKPGAVGRPPAIAVDSEDRIYVANPNDDTLQIFDPQGKPLQFVRSLGKAATPPAVRTGIAVDRAARVYVVDQQSGRGRLQIFEQSRQAGRPATQPVGDRRPR